MPPWTRAWWIVLAAVTALRAAVAATLPMQGTESYYWMWSRHLAAGYYDHPPLIAWGIRAGTALFGQTEFGVRCPVLAGITLATVALWALGRRMGGEEAGARAGLAALAFPWMTYLSITAFPDGLMLGFAGLSLLLAWPGRAALAGAALGLSFLAKFPAALLAAATVAWRRDPRFLAPWAGAALLACSPFLAWNATNGWATFAFQAGERQVREGRFHPLGPLEFAGLQAAVGSPILVAVLLGAVAWAFRRREDEGRFLAWHALVPLGAFAGLSFLHRVQPHWPLVGWLTAFVALGLACAGSARFRQGWKAGVGLGGALVVLVLAAGLFPGLLFAVAGRPTGASVTEPFGYAAVGPTLAEREPAGGFLVAEHHGIAASLEFYAGRPVHLFSRNLHGREYLRWEDYPSLAGRDALFVDVHPMRDRPDVRAMLEAGFAEVGSEEEVLVRWRGHPARTFYLTPLRGFRGRPPS